MSDTKISRRERRRRKHENRARAVAQPAPSLAPVDAGELEMGAVDDPPRSERVQELIFNAMSHLRSIEAAILADRQSA